MDLVEYYTFIEAAKIWDLVVALSLNQEKLLVMATNVSFRRLGTYLRLGLVSTTERLGLVSAKFLNVSVSRPGVSGLGWEGLECIPASATQFIDYCGGRVGLGVGWGYG